MGHGLWRWRSAGSFWKLGEQGARGPSPVLRELAFGRPGELLRSPAEPSVPWERRQPTSRDGVRRRGLTEGPRQGQALGTVPARWHWSRPGRGTVRGGEGEQMSWGGTGWRGRGSRGWCQAEAGTGREAGQGGPRGNWGSVPVTGKPWWLHLGKLTGCWGCQTSLCSEGPPCRPRGQGRRELDTGERGPWLCDGASLHPSDPLLCAEEKGSTCSQWGSVTRAGICLQTAGGAGGCCTQDH